MTVKHASHFRNETQTDNIHWINFTEFLRNSTEHNLSTIKFKDDLKLLNYNKKHKCFDSKHQIITIVIII